MAIVRRKLSQIAPDIKVPEGGRLLWPVTH
jgi:hypothetical protein